MYYFCMSHYIAGPTPMIPNTLPELQAAYSRVLRAGLGLRVGESDEDGNAVKAGDLDEELVTLDPMDPRAIDFRNFLRTWCVKIHLQ